MIPGAADFDIFGRSKQQLARQMSLGGSGGGRLLVVEPAPHRTRTLHYYVVPVPVALGSRLGYAEARRDPAVGAAAREVRLSASAVGPLRVHRHLSLVPLGIVLEREGEGGGVPCPHALFERTGASCADVRSGTGVEAELLAHDPGRRINRLEGLIAVETMHAHRSPAAVLKHVEGAAGVLRQPDIAFRRLRAVILECTRKAQVHLVGDEGGWLAGEGLSASPGGCPRGSVILTASGTEASETAGQFAAVHRKHDQRGREQQRRAQEGGQDVGPDPLPPLFKKHLLPVVLF
mmetsp:Transcript_42131/g.103877  ORF Transcript_42131/g.103877 Transcript_42131/m.103877 type:complete len:291 (-) Transcript_42131:1991-2863(-)